ncbi:hypothetical protein [Coleofasciculus sp. H7-2]|uniref:DUF7689 domain-containing protein n=1 Tax=Coleofasciculus sp. H7-2 TaxID=3351545 RepID=UPI00366F67DE
MARLDSWIATYCPKLSRDQYQITSPETSDYNCFSWGAEEDDRWWDPTDPDQYWPDGVPKELTLEAFIQAYQTVGYAPCNSVELEPGFQKIAIYTKDDGQLDGGQPTHAARQLPNGKWTSKMGDLEDIEHELNGLRGFYYGDVAQILKRPVSS